MLMRFRTPEEQKRDEDLTALLREAVKGFERLSSEEQAEMRQRQRRSWVLGEAAIGSDADEAEYATALRDGDQQKIAECEARSLERRARADKMLAEGRI